ncbi:MAG: DUF2478 domain-containing protein [Rhodospirillaceae bacterium]|nr:DUF2478 domain-containing protein [Rhodospirillales bacterium]
MGCGSKTSLSFGQDDGYSLREIWGNAMPAPTRLPVPPAIGAVVYPPDHPPEALLAAFAAELSARGFRVGGLAQETRQGDYGCKCRMEVVELDTGRRLSISQDLGGGSSACSLDPAALAEASGAVRRAVTDGVDLLFINKFSKSEKAGRGLAAEMLDAMAAGVPLLTALPGVLMEEWTAFTGGRGQLLMPTEDALWQWWGPGRLYDDLALGVSDEPALRVIVGLNWTLVEGPHGVGLAQTPDRGTPACTAVAGDWTGKPLCELAALVRSWDPFHAAIGMAAINAHYNRFDLKAPDINGLDVLETDPAGLVVVGAFPGLAARLPGAKVIDRRPTANQYPEETTHWLLPRAEGILITASALANRSLPNLLRLAQNIPVALIGPGATLTPRLLSYGVTVSCGLIATDVAGMARAVAEGGGAKDLKRFGRQAALN